MHNMEFFANSAIYCLKQSVKAKTENSAKTWLSWAINDFKVCFKKWRDEIENEEPLGWTGD